MKKFISFGKYNLYYKFIIFSIIFRLIYNIIIGVQIGYSTEELRIFPKNSLSDHFLIHDLFNYFGIFIIALIFRIFKIIYIRKKNKKKNEEEEKNINNGIMLIHNKITIKDSYNIWTLAEVVFISCIWIFHEQSEKIFYYCNLTDLDYWPIEMLIVAYLLKYIFGVKIYKHQKFSFYFILIIGSLNKFFSFFISLILNDQNILYIKYKKIIPLGIIIFFIIIFLRSYANTKEKWLMDLKYVSIDKLLIYYGLFGTIICSIFCLLTTYIDCKTDVCLIKDEESSKYYYENFNIYFDKLKKLPDSDYFIEIIFIFTSSIIYFCLVLYNLLIIQYLTPIHCICSGAIYYILIELILIIINKIKNGRFFKEFEENNKEKRIKYFLDFSSDIFSLFSTAIYLELIVFNFCGCNYNLRTTIIERSKKEGKNINEPNDDENNNDNLNLEMSTFSRVNTKNSVNSINY